MKNYKNYEIEDFICDDDFITWSMYPDEKSNQFWLSWLQSNPKQKLVLQQAKQLVLDLHTIEVEKKEGNFEQEIWDRIETNIIEKENISKNRFRFLQWGFSVAAMILVLIGVGLLFQNNETFHSTTKMADLEWVNFQNDSGLSKTIHLSDNSIVVLEPFSSLKYPAKFEGSERAVFLKGEAFFDIARDTLNPFLVYANETITKVLGTSFRITAFEGEKKVEVDVKSGKVAVYAEVLDRKKKRTKKRMVVETDERISIPRPNKKLEVTPNQKVVFNKTTEGGEMIKTVTEKPKIITEFEALPQFEFNNESVIKVFEALEQAYGIDLEFEKDRLKGCTITTKLADESLFQKLSIICRALNLNFVEKNATIFIEGEGC